MYHSPICHMCAHQRRYICSPIHKMSYYLLPFRTTQIANCWAMDYPHSLSNKSMFQSTKDGEETLWEFGVMGTRPDLVRVYGTLNCSRVLLALVVVGRIH